MPIQTDNVSVVYSKQDLIDAVARLAIDKPVTIVLHRQSGGITIYHFTYVQEFTLDDRIANIQKQIRKIPRQAFL